MRELGSATAKRSTDASPPVSGAGTAQKLAFSYKRVSTAKQKWKTGLQRQEKAFAAWLEDHPEFVWCDFSFEEAESGRTKHRTKGTLARLLKCLKRGRLPDGRVIPQGSCIVVETFSRLTRDQPDDAIELCLEIFKAGYTLAFPQWGGDVLNRKTERVWSKIIDASEASSLEYEDKCARMQEVCDDKVERLRAGDLSMFKERGEKKQTDYPFWLDFNESKQEFVEVKEHTNWLKRAFEMIKTKSVDEISRTLRIPSLKDPDKILSANTIERYLKNEAVIGYRVITRGSKPTGEKFRIYPRLVSDIDFNEAQQAMRNRRTNNGKNKSPKLRNLFAKRTYCSNCGSVVGVKPSPDGKGGYYFYLKCNANERDPEVCTKSKIPYSDQYLINLLNEFQWESFFSDHNQEQDLDAAKSEVVKTQSAVDEIQDKIDVIEEEVVQRVLDRERGLVLDTLERKLEVLKVEKDKRKQDLDKAQSFLNQLRQIPASADLSLDVREQINLMMKSDLSDINERHRINEYLHDVGICIAIDLDQKQFDVGIGKVVNRKLVELDMRQGDLVGLGLSPVDAEAAIKDIETTKGSTGRVWINGELHRQTRVRATSLSQQQMPQQQ